MPSNQSAHRTSVTMGSSLSVFAFVPIALAVTFALFAFMSWMVDFKSLTIEDEKNLSINILVNEQESETRRRQRELPEPPEPQPSEPAAVQPSTPVAASTAITTDMDIDMDLSIEGVAISAPSLDVSAPTTQAAVSTSIEAPSVDLSAQLTPTYRPVQKYPPRALKRGIEGQVVLSFDIDEEGQPINITIIEATPRRVFDREAKRFLARSKYPITRVDGEPIIKPNNTITVSYQLDK
ncbi:energy transducer TonB [Vibrio sp.]|nr:energy transducer TonB [Vibrio sp.]